MLIHTLRPLARGELPYRAIELEGVRHVLTTAIPGHGETLPEQMREGIGSIEAVLEQCEASGGLVHLAVFLAEPALVAPCRRWLRGHYGAEMPAVSFIPQPPCDGSLVGIEAMAVRPEPGKVSIERLNEHLVVVRHNNLAWVFADQAVPRTSAEGVYEKTICTYQHLLRLLPKGGARLDQVVRTWIYLGSIVANDGDEQRYKSLNRARSEFYQNVPFLSDHLPEGLPNPVYPASTGIGTEGRGLCISALAVLSEREDVYTVPLENPRQTAAYDYSAVYSPRSPKFSRGLALVAGSDATLFISGTASITHSETQHIGDPAAQTAETLENIRVLISEENLARHGLPGYGAKLEQLAAIRVYVKRLEDYPAIRAVVQQQLPDLPTLYTVADVCRPDLLVEIEGIAFSSCPGPALQLHRAARKACAGPPFCCPASCPDRSTCPHAILG